MGVNSLFNQTIIHYPKARFNKDGREVVGDGTSYKARVQPVTKTRLTLTGTFLRVDLIVYVNRDFAGDINDKIRWDSRDYRIFTKSQAIGGSGSTHHIKLECIQWKAL